MEERNYPQLGERVLWDTLPNGLTVAVVPRKGFSRKIAYFVTDFGAIHREFTLDGEKIVTPEGIAHFLEHKMFDLPGRDVSEEFAALGAMPNAFTSYDMTAYYFSCTENFEAALKLLLEFVSTPYFTEESVEKELGIIGQEIGMNEDNPDTRVFESLVCALYREHPVRVPILGSRESIAKITPELLYQCHRAFYRPGNMLLCVVGDVDPDTVRKLAEEQLPKEDTVRVERKRQWQEEMTALQPLTEQKMEVAMPMFQLGFKAEPLADGEEGIRQEMVGELATEVLFGESSSLYLRLYEEGLIDTSFGGGLDCLEGMSLLMASGDSRDPKAVQEAILEEAQRLVREGIREEDFLRMKRSAIGRRIRGLDSFDGTAFRICAYHFSKFDYFKFPGVLKSVEADAVLAFIQQTVTRQRCSLSVIYPKEG